MSKQTVTGGVSAWTVLLIVFIVLKLCNLIDWSWGWVLSPLWIPLSIVVLVVIIVLFIYFTKS
jgi:hypothetical protein